MYSNLKTASTVIFACFDYKKFDGNPLLVNHGTQNYWKLPRTRGHKIHLVTLIKIYFLINSSNSEKWYTLLMNINSLNAEIFLSAVFAYMLDSSGLDERTRPEMKLP